MPRPDQPIQFFAQRGERLAGCGRRGGGAVASILSQAPTVTQAAKDILRAAALPLLPRDDPEVAKDVKRVAKGQPLSPVLLVRGDLAAGRLLQIADGYHRVCALLPGRIGRTVTGGTFALIVPGWT